jgi:2-polyprenyl-3-methyl-5-hydroxy-6-metoxy-1,4-benzoquinol methylase
VTTEAEAEKRTDAAPEPRTRPRLLVFIVAYNAEKTIEGVLGRIPSRLLDDYDVETLVIDDSSHDSTFDRSETVRKTATLAFPLHVLFNPVNQGYGGNQKIGFHYAIQEGFDYVALVHGDGQYAPECLPDLVRPVRDGEADAVLGSRMLARGGARRGGMPLYKLVGNRILSRFQNALLSTNLSEFHSGYRVYSTHALRSIPFDLNTNDFHFDTEIIIQLLYAAKRIHEVPIPTYYGDEICRVNGLKYAANVARATLKARVQELGLLYERKFDVGPSDRENAQYVSKFGYESPHTLALESVKPGSRVLDLGCAGGSLGVELRRRGCHVVGVDIRPLEEGVELDGFYLHDLNEGLHAVELGHFDYVLLLDVIEHLNNPERFLEELYAKLSLNPDATVVISTGNIAFGMTRMLLLAGHFNYGKRGILDLTHTRLFTFSTLRRALDGAGFRVLQLRGVPAPFPLALGDSGLARALMALNRRGTGLWKRFFAYQIFAIAQPRPSLDLLLRDAHISSAIRAGAIARDH